MFGINYAQYQRAIADQDSGGMLAANQGIFKSYAAKQLDGSGTNVFPALHTTNVKDLDGSGTNVFPALHTSNVKDLDGSGTNVFPALHTTSVKDLHQKFVGVGWLATQDARNMDRSGVSIFPGLKTQPFSGEYQGENPPGAQRTGGGPDLGAAVARGYQIGCLDAARVPGGRNWFEDQRRTVVRPLFVPAGYGG